jgi:hypothetical protein
MEKPFDPETKDAGWRALYIAGGVAALLAVFVFRRNLAAELALVGMFGFADGLPTAPLVGAIEWFNLLQDNRLIGLTMLNFFDLVEFALVGLILLALLAALWDANRSAMLIATTTGLIGITVYTLVFAPTIYWLPHPISAPFRVVWYFLIALRLFKLATA